MTELNARLAGSEEALRAIRSGEVDAMLMPGRHGNQVFTLQGAEHDYRILIESMNEGALTLSAAKTILYANASFARMVKCPLEQVTGGSFRRYISAADRATLRPFLERSGESGAKIPMRLNATDGSHVPVQISIRRLAKKDPDGATLSMVVTDLTDARRNEEMLRALTHRVVQVQETERGRIAAELHDNITQPLCAVLFGSQALVDGISHRNGPAKKEAVKLRALLGRTADEVERISRYLRPGTLEQLGLVEVMRDTMKNFARQTGVCVRENCAELMVRLPGETELALYRILEEALRNVKKHAGARHVSVSLKEQGGFIELAIKDDGTGFNLNSRPGGREGKPGLGLLGMRERASYVGGSFAITSGRRAGTEITVRVPRPLSAGPSAAK